MMSEKRRMRSISPVAVLFARQDSIYKNLPGCDVYDIDRDALSYSGGMPIVAHPPCRGWGRLRHFAKPRPGELDLARFAVRMIRKNGGVLEHPVGSSLWLDQNLPPVGSVDEWGGFTIQVHQFDFGHLARKSTFLYICGLTQGQLPVPSLQLGEPGHVVAKTKNPRSDTPIKPEISKSEREHRPIEFALYLIQIAQKCGQSGVDLGHFPQIQNPTSRRFACSNTARLSHIETFWLLFDQFSGGQDVIC